MLLQNSFYDSIFDFEFDNLYLLFVFGFFKSQHNTWLKGFCICLLLFYNFFEPLLSLSQSINHQFQTNFNFCLARLVIRSFPAFLQFFIYSWSCFSPHLSDLFTFDILPSLSLSLFAIFLFRYSYSSLCSKFTLTNRSIALTSFYSNLAMFGRLNAHHHTGLPCFSLLLLSALF